MGKLKEAVRRFLTSVDFRFREESDKFSFCVNAKQGHFDMTVRTQEPLDRIIVHARLPLNVPEETRLAMSDLLGRIDWDLMFGCFAMDMRNGELRYKTAINLEGVFPIPSAVIRHLIGLSISTVDLFYPAVCTILYTDTEPAEAISQIENCYGLPDGVPICVIEEPIPIGAGFVDSEQTPLMAHRSKLDRIRSALAELRRQKNENPCKDEKS